MSWNTAGGLSRRTIPDTEFEYEETLQKAKAIREAVYECEAG